MACSRLCEPCDHERSRSRFDSALEWSRRLKSHGRHGRGTRSPCYTRRTMEILPAIDLRGGRCVRLRQGDYNQETVFGDDPAAQAQAVGRWRRHAAASRRSRRREGRQAGQHRCHPLDREGREGSLPGRRRNPRRRSRGTAAQRHRRRSRHHRHAGPEAARLVHPRCSRSSPARPCSDSMPATASSRRPAGSKSRTSPRPTSSSSSSITTSQTVIYTNIANDGMMQGIDDGTLDDLARMSELGPEVIASGGVTTLKDIERLMAIAAGSSATSSA